MSEFSGSTDQGFDYDTVLSEEDARLYDRLYMLKRVLPERITLSEHFGRVQARKSHIVEKLAPKLANPRAAVDSDLAARHERLAQVLSVDYQLARIADPDEFEVELARVFFEWRDELERVSSIYGVAA